MPLSEETHGCPSSPRARPAAGAWAAGAWAAGTWAPFIPGLLISGLLISGAMSHAWADSPRLGSPAWFSAFNAQRGVTSPSTASGSVSGANIAPNSPAGANGGVARSMSDFAQAARAIAQAQAAQTQASRTQAAQATQAQAARNGVPDGLTPGGLWVNPGAVAANPALWSGAAPATAAPSTTATGAAGHAGGTVVTVVQTAKTADLTWNSFNVGANTTLRFNQGGSDWTVLNRVNDPSAAPSRILGAISASGLVLVLNPNGILFGTGSQVNVGGLVASTANLAAAQFNGILSTQTSAGVYDPTFAGATAPVTVQAGASITTNSPASAANSGGYVLLLGQSVRNDGQIMTANGQTVLAAGQSFVVRAGYSVDNNPTSTTLGLEIAPSGAGTVTNTGLVQANTGDITLTGEIVLQGGVLLSTTTVGQRGTIHLLTNTTDSASSITFAPGSLTAIQPQNDGTTATDTARANLISQSAANNNLRGGASLLSNQAALPDQQYQSRIEIVSGGSVEFQDGSLNLSTGGQIAVYALGRIFADSGATLSVAGSIDTVLPASANTLQISVQGYDLRDAPANRDTGAVTSQLMNVAIGPLVQIGDLQYTSGGLLEVSGYVAGVGHSIGEWTSIGGTIALNAPEVVAQQGALFNISGGLVTYAAGRTANTWLVASNGQIYNVNTAPANVTYDGVYGGFTVSQPRWGVTETFNSPLIAPAGTDNAAYTVGRDGGTLTISAPTTVMEATIAAGVSAGEFQNGARPAGVADPFTLAQAVVPLPGSLVIGPATLGNTTPTVATTDVLITGNDQPLASSLGLTTPIPADRAGTTWLAADLLNDAALGGLTVVTQAAIRVDAAVTLADGGAVSLFAPSVTLTGSLTARGGQVSVGNYSVGYSTTNFLDATGPGGTVSLPAVTLGSGAAIDTEGVFTNLAIDPATSAGLAFVNGGAVAIDTSGAVTLAAGATIDASAGGAVLANRTAKGGAGGAVSITAYDTNDPNASVPSASTLSTPVTIAATLRALGSGSVPCTACKGGALTLTVPEVTIGADNVADGSALTLTPDFFAAGFSSYTIVGQNGVTVANGTQIAAVQPIRQFTATTALTPGGTDPAAAFATGLPALYTPNPATASMTQRPGVSVTLRAGDTLVGAVPTITNANAGITIGAGSAIAVDPTQTISLEAAGQITINGTLTASAGTISVLNDQFEGTSNSLSIWLGGTSVLNVSAQAVTAADNSGRVFGTVPNGGTIAIGGQSDLDVNGNPKSTNAFVVIQPGAVLSAAGTSAGLNPSAGQTLGVGRIGRPAAGPMILAASAGGAISLDSESGIYLGGQIGAPPGGTGAQGGTLAVTLVTPDYTDATRFNGGPVPDLAAYNAPRTLVVGTSEAAPPGAVQPGEAFSDAAFGQARVATSQIAAGGFDAVNLTSGDAILFDGSVTLSAGRSITLSTAILGATTVPGATGGAATVSVSAPYVTLTGTGTATQSGLTFRRSITGANGSGGTSPNWQPSAQTSQATIAINAANIDVSGNLYVGVNAPVISVPLGGTTPCTLASCAVVDLPGFASMTLSSSADIRFLPAPPPVLYTTLTTPGNLTLAAGQVYPVAGTNAIVTAGLMYDAVNTVASYDDTLSYNGTLTIAPAPGPVPAAPPTAGGQLTLRAQVIDQGGVLRAPDGQLTIGSLGTSFQYAPNLTQNAFSSQVVLLPGSITSVSMNGLTIPYGGTSDGTTYTLNGAAVTGTTLLPPQIAVNAQAIQVQAAATIDVSGGGVLAGAGFVPGRGGSSDILQSPLLALTVAGTVTALPAATNLVFAIVPGFEGSVAPPPATATAFTGPLPGAGDQITLGAGVPGLPAGTYTLLPGSDALLPGAYRVELATTAHSVLAGATNLGNGSYLVNGYRGVANTNILASLPIGVTVTPGAAVRLDAQYDETSYADFALSQAALFNQSRASLTLPADAKTLAFGFPATTQMSGLALQIQGAVASAPGPGGLGGIVEMNAQANIEVVAGGATPTPGWVSVLAADLDGMRANTLIVGGGAALNALNGEEQFTSSTTAATVRDGATLSASQIFLVSTGAITVERGATVTTIGASVPSLNSNSGLTFNNNNLTVLAVSNGTLTFQPATGGGPIAIGSCPAACAGPATLLSAGTIAAVTTDTVTLDSTTRFGTSALNLSTSVVNFGSPPVGAPAGLTLTPDALQSLIAGDAADGVPGLRQLTLTASDSVNFYGDFSLNTLDPVTGQSTLQSLQLNSPAIYGAPGVTASLTTGTFTWNNVLASGGTASLTPGIWARGGGTSGSSLSISANTIVLGYGPSDQAQNQVTLDRLILGFDSVTLTASQSIAGNNKGSLSVYRTGTQDSGGALVTMSGGDLTMNTPLLTGAPGSVITITTGGSLTVAGPATQQMAGAAGGQGASLTLKAVAGNISNSTSIVLPSGQLIMNAFGSIGLGGGSRLDLAGMTTTLFDQSTSGWGGSVTLQAATGGITQSTGGTIDVSAGNANAGSVTILAPGVVNLAGTINGGAAPGYVSGSFSVRAGGLGAGDPTSGFAALNSILDLGGVFGGRSFELLTGDLTIGAGTAVTANSVSVSVDAGTLTVAGMVNASGTTPGTIRLSAGGNLTVAGTAMLDAQGTVAQTDSYGSPIDSENAGIVTLTVSGNTAAGINTGTGTIALGSGAVIDVSGGNGSLALGQVNLNAPRTGETSGGVNVSAAGPVTIKGAASIAVNAFWTYAPTDANGTIVQDNGMTLTKGVTAAANSASGSVGLMQIDHNSTIFMGNADLIPPANLAGLASHGSSFHLRPGVEIDSAAPTGNLTVASDLDLSGYRYSDPAGYGLKAGSVVGSGEPGVLVLRAGNGLTILGSINDGFTGAPSLCETAAACAARFTYWELAQPLAPDSAGSPALSWSIRLVAGADLAAADSRIVLPSDQLTAAAAVPVTPSSAASPCTPATCDPPGSIELYDPHPQPFNSDLPAAATAALLPGWSVIRTGTGDLDLLAGGSIDEQSTYAIYTAGTSPSLPAGSAYNLPRGTVATPSQVTFAGRSGTQIKAGTLITDGTTEFRTLTTGTIRGFPLVFTVFVQPVTQGSVYDDPAGTTLRLVNPLAGVTLVKATNVLSSTGTVLGVDGGATNNGVTLESLAGKYQAWYPEGGGNVLISAGGNITGYLATPTSGASSASGLQPQDGVGDWLWRQGEGQGLSGAGAGANTAWWINFGTLALPLSQIGSVTQSSPVPTLTGFTGIGALGGGNVTILAGGNIGASNQIAAPSTAQYTLSQAIDVAIASTGRVSQGATDGSGIIQTGGGALTIQAGGALNGGGTASGTNQANGTLTDTRGSIDVVAGSIGQIALNYGTVNNGAGSLEGQAGLGAQVGDPRAASPLTASQAAAQGGPIVVPGDATVSLEARGDLVLGGAGDPTRLTEQNLTPAGLTSGGAASGLTWFSLWQPNTAIHLASAGGNLVVSTQAVVEASAGPQAQENAIATDNRFLYPPTLTAVASSGSIYAGTEAASTASGAASSIELAPSPVGQLELLAAGSIYDDSTVLNGQPQSFDISGASTAALPSPFNAAFMTTVGGASNLNASIGAQSLPLSLFAFEADTASGTLHAGDAAPALIYAGRDIVDMQYGETLSFTASSGITPTVWYVSGKAVRMIAGGDLVEPGTLDFVRGPDPLTQPYTLLAQTSPAASGNYTSTSGLIVNNNAADVSVLQAGGNIIYANATVAGPGQLYVQAGGNVYQADKGTLESLGPLIDGALSAGPSRTGGAGITVLAGAGSSGPDWTAFAQAYLTPAMGYGPALLNFLQASYGYTGDETGAPGFFEALPIEQQRTFLLQVYFDELRDSGREFTNPASVRYKSYIRGRTAIATLFPEGSAGNGGITMFSTTSIVSNNNVKSTLIGNSGIRSDFGGTVTLLTPNGATTLGNTNQPSSIPVDPPGVLTQGTGDVDIFSQGSVILGQSRVFTTFGGSIVIWSAAGDINAGRGSRTTQLVSTPVIEYDAFGRVTLTPGIPTSGAGIATLAPIPGTPPGDVDLIAPLGVIDAGEAGIRVSGNANLAALTVVNAANVQVGGKSTGLPTIAAPNVSALSAASATAASAAQSAQGAAVAAGTQNNQSTPSTITVELVGFGDF